MAKLSAKTAATVLAGTDELPINQDTTTTPVSKKSALTLIRNWILGNAADGSDAAPSFAFASDPDTGFYSHSANFIGITTGGACRAIVNSSGLRMTSTVGLGFSSSPTNAASADAYIYRDAAGQLAIRNSTNAQSLAVYTTESSSLTNYERLRIYGTAASAFTIASEAAGTGTVRSIEFKIGAASMAGIDTFGVTSAGNFTAATSGAFRWPVKAGIYSPADSVIRLANNAGTDFGRLQFGGTTSSFPAIKRSGTSLQARLADDSDYGTYQGKIQTHANAVSESITPTHTLTIYDAAGTAYKVAVQAA